MMKWNELLLDVARLRRLNDTECPLILANQWLQETEDSLGCAKTLVLQESQNGEIPVSKSTYLASSAHKIKKKKWLINGTSWLNL